MLPAKERFLEPVYLQPPGFPLDLKLEIAISQGLANFAGIRAQANSSGRG